MQSWQLTNYECAYLCWHKHIAYTRPATPHRVHANTQQRWNLWSTNYYATATVSITWRQFGRKKNHRDNHIFFQNKQAVVYADPTDIMHECLFLFFFFANQRWYCSMSYFCWHETLKLVKSRVDQLIVEITWWCLCWVVQSYLISLNRELQNIFH